MATEDDDEDHRRAEEADEHRSLSDEDRDSDMDDDDDYTDDNEDDTHGHNATWRRVVVLTLCIVLTGLLANVGYVLIQINTVSRSHPPGDTETLKENVQTKSHHQGEGKASEKHSKKTRVSERQKLTDHEEYQMPQHPTRIYSHASLSSRNYRAGGVLSDEMLHRFEQDGVLVIRNLISPKLLDRLNLASQMLIDGQDEDGKKKRRGTQFHMVKHHVIFLGVPPPKEEKVCANNTEDNSCESDAGPGDSVDSIILSSFRDLAMYSKIPRVVASLLRLDEMRVGGEQYLKRHDRKKRSGEARNQGEGNEGDEQFNIDDSINLRICRDIFLTKDDDDYGCGWHVDDTGFWPNLASDPGVNAWVALDDMPAPTPGIKVSPHKQHSPVATFALSLGSHRVKWRNEAYQITGSTHTNPPEGYQSASDLIQRRTGSGGTCNIQSSAPDLYEKLEKNKVIFDLKKGDVIFHDRWIFHRTVPMREYGKMMNVYADQEQDVERNKPHSTSPEGKIFRRHSIRYAPGTATVPPGFGVELSVLHDYNNANRTLDEIVQRSGPWYPKVWPHVLKKKPPQSSGKSTDIEEEIDGITELVYDKMPKAEILQKSRKQEIRRLLSRRGAE